jgi:hypothetical protein
MVLLSLLIAGPQLSERPMYRTELCYLHQSVDLLLRPKLVKQKPERT